MALGLVGGLPQQVITGPAASDDHQHEDDPRPPEEIDALSPLPTAACPSAANAMAVRESGAGLGGEVEAVPVDVQRPVAGLGGDGGRGRGEHDRYGDRPGGRGSGLTARVGRGIVVALQAGAQGLERRAKPLAVPTFGPAFASCHDPVQRPCLGECRRALRFRQVDAVRTGQVRALHARPARAAAALQLATGKCPPGDRPAGRKWRQMTRFLGRCAVGLRDQRVRGS